uniref:Mesothelin a n=1 Tax=Echeneis naucrates TaxID=173247 RepID=A0A665SY26_ECHNA
SNAVIQNVPDDFATEIPPALLAGESKQVRFLKTFQSANVVKWYITHCVCLCVCSLSSSVLQGFTCTGVRTIRKVQVKRLIRACRRRGQNRVTLVETQLTCMYNLIRGDSDVTSFDLYPPDMLLFYDYSLVPLASCRSYFEQLADADFFVFSSALLYKRTALFDNARSCLGITSTSLTQDNILVLGNMCCSLDGSYIENSDPSILEKLNNCRDLTRLQATAVQTLLLSGRTQFGYGNKPSTWNGETLEQLGNLPLYLTSTFYENFDRVITDVWCLKHLFCCCEQRTKKRFLRSFLSSCTVGNITQVTISDETFPFDYDDITQFNCCLSAETVVNNLDAITNKVDEEEYLRIVLNKLQEVGVFLDQVQLLGPASRLAATDDINRWNITQLDTLSALMDSSDGEWEPSLAKAIISKYLSKAGNELGSAELNAIGGVNLCSLDADVLKTISQKSLNESAVLDVSICTLDKKKELFTIARQAFSDTTRSNISPSSYMRTRPFVGRRKHTNFISLDCSVLFCFFKKVSSFLTF